MSKQPEGSSANSDGLSKSASSTAKSRGTSTTSSTVSGGSSGKQVIKQKARGCSVARTKSTRSSLKSTCSTSKSSTSPNRKSLLEAKIGFVGGGVMTNAITTALRLQALIKCSVFVSAKSDKTLAEFKRNGYTVTKYAYQLFHQFDCDIVFLCIPGAVIRACFKTDGTPPSPFTVLHIPVPKHPLYILSLIGGVTLDQVRATLLDPNKMDQYPIFMHRLMLNVSIGACLVEAGLGALDIEPALSEPMVRDLLFLITPLEHIPEPEMDAACAIGGNGLAFIYYFVAGLTDGAIRQGLDKRQAIQLASMTLQSASRIVLSHGKHPREMQESLTPPGGPAIYGINILQNVSCASKFQFAIEAIFRRIKGQEDTAA